MAAVPTPSFTQSMIQLVSEVSSALAHLHSGKGNVPWVTFRWPHDAARPLFEESMRLVALLTGSYGERFSPLSTFTRTSA